MKLNELINGSKNQYESIILHARVKSFGTTHDIALGIMYLNKSNCDQYNSKFGQGLDGEVIKIEWPNEKSLFVCING